MQLVIQYHAGIDWIVRESGQSDKFVHVQVGLDRLAAVRSAAPSKAGKAVAAGPRDSG
jgi:hypothetical protein